MSPNNDFEEHIRSLLREAGRSAERAAAQGKVDAIAQAVGVEPARARQWLEGAAGWLGAQSAGSDDAPSAPRPSARKVADPPQGAEPHPLDTPSAEQGVALAALDSGRWSVEPGSNALSTHGKGPGPIDAIGLFGELRAHDWITAQGAVTVVGRHALTRWLEDAEQS